MSAIPAASVNMRTMADGTLRVTFDIEPNQSQDAFRLFAAPGTPVAIAALQVGYAAKSVAEIPVSEKEPIGPLCKWLVIRCGEPEFWAWLNAEGAPSADTITNEAEASEVVKFLLSVESRKEIDGNSKNEEYFHRAIRHPYQKWLVRRSG